MFYRLKSKLIDLPPYLWGVITFLIIIFSVPIISNVYDIAELKFSWEINFFASTAIPLFVTTIVGLAKNRRVQAASLVRDHISEFLRNKELYSAFHELIYTYSDKNWELVKELLPEDYDRGIPNKTDEMRKTVAELLLKQDINKNRKEEGSRFYDPDYFQGSQEEQRLDAVLHFFDMLAYNQQRKLISVDDITGVSGYHLAVIGSREVITYYLDQNDKYWENLPYQNRIGAEKPYTNLRNLLSEIKRKNLLKTSDELRSKAKCKNFINCQMK